MAVLSAACLLPCCVALVWVMVSSFLVVLDFLVCAAVDIGTLADGRVGLSTAAKRSFGRAHSNAIGPPCSIRVFALSMNTETASRTAATRIGRGVIVFERHFIQRASVPAESGLCRRSSIFPSLPPP